MATYSFMDVTCTLAGAGGVVDLGYGTATAEEGITFSMTDDKNTMTVGADGEVMNSLHAAKNGTATVRLLKTSPANSKLIKMYLLQQSTSVSWGQNVIACRSSSGNDLIGGRSVVFKKVPDITYAKDGGMMEWVFDIGKLDIFLGEYAQ